MNQIQRSRHDQGSAQTDQAQPRPGFLMTRPPAATRNAAKASFSQRLAASRPFVADPTD